MRVLFFNPEIKSYVRSATVPLGLLSIASFLQSRGHTVKIIDRSLESGDIDEQLDAFSPDIAGVSVVSNKGISDAMYISRTVRAHGIPVVWGGTMPSNVPELVALSGLADFVSVGEGEMTWLELLAAIEDGRDAADVAGLVFERDGKIVTTDSREFIDLAVLPPTDWSLVDVPRYFQPYYGCRRVLYLYTSKGCPCHCTFCFNPRFHRSTHRERPVEHVMSEIKQLVTEYGMDGIYFSDELWTMSRERMHELCDAFKASGLSFFWGCQSRVGIYDSSDFEHMYSCGCRWIFFGVESGCPETLRRIKKGISPEKVRSSLEQCTKSGIMTVAAFIIGFPDETYEQIAQSVKFALSLRTSQWQFSLYMPFPDSEIYEQLVSSGRLKPPGSLEEMAGILPTEKLCGNFSCVSDRELVIIRSFFMWKCFAMKELSKDFGSYGFAKKTARDALVSLRGHGAKHFFIGVYLSAKQLAQTFFYAHFFPSVRKKYGLK